MEYIAVPIVRETNIPMSAPLFNPPINVEIDAHLWNIEAIKTPQTRQLMAMKDILISSAGISITALILASGAMVSFNIIPHNNHPRKK
jgi:hypothetical protein